MKLKTFNYSEFKQFAENKMGLTAPINNNEGNAWKQYFRNSKGEKESGDAISAIPFVPNENNIVIASVWHLAPMTITNQERLQTEAPEITFVVAKGANVLNVHLGDIVNISQHTNVHKVEVVNNSCNMLDLIEHYRNPLTKLSGSDSTRPVFIVEYFVLNASGVLGVYGSLEEFIWTKRIEN